jgi:tetratricopeptide (TPR) repeat protein
LSSVLAFLVLAPCVEAQDSAGQYRELGDMYVSQDKLKDAADAYEHALSRDRSAFTPDERVRMAVIISWENRLDRAIDELQNVLLLNPQHLEARLQLARVYSWRGDLAKAIAEADRVLKQSPENSEAMLIKADALEWQGLFRRAIPIYREVLERDRPFDAQVGLAYALLSAGNQAEAGQNVRKLSAASGHQKRQLDKLAEALDSVHRPKVDVRYNQYQDSDHNRMDRYSLLYGFGLGNQSFALNMSHEDNRSRTAENRSDAASLTFLSNISDGVRVGAGGGLTRSGGATLRNFGTGQVRIDAGVSNATVGASVNTDMLTGTTQLIENHIRATTYAGYIAKPWTGRFSTYAGYTHQVFSDGNNANGVQFTPQLTVRFVPRIAVGYRFRYLDFREQSGSGFFDPDNYVSHRAFASFSVEKKKISTYVDIFGGKQSFVRNAYPSDNWVYGGSASIAYSPVRSLAIELNGEGGNFDAASVAGFKYSIAGMRVSYRF